MVRITPTQGRFDTTLTSVATDMRKPVFVDNAVHYAKIEPSSTGSDTITIEGRNKENYDIATEKTYHLVESESSILLTHEETDGHSLKSAIWTGEGKNIPSSLLYSVNEPNIRLKAKSESATANGLRMELHNMKGRSLKDIGFKDDSIHFGQLVDVGFRTTDLAVRIANDISGTLTAVSIGDSMTMPNSAYRRKHSTSFLATDFNSVNLITAMRYISRHDDNIPFYNRHGILMYVPMNYFSNIDFLDASTRLGDKHKNPVNNAENRVSVRGRKLAVNDDIVVSMDDRSKQQGKYSNDVIESISPVFDASVTSIQQARAVARNMLKANNTLDGKITSQRHPGRWNLRPGDIVMYDGKKRMIVNTTHRLSDTTSDFTMVSEDSGLQGVLQGILEGGISEGSIINPSKEQVTKENFSFFSDLEIIVVPFITSRYVADGFLIGQNSNRGAIGWSNKTIGLNKADPVTIRGEL